MHRAVLGYDRDMNHTMNHVIRHAQIGDTSLPYVEAGAGDPVILMHGALGDWRTFAPVADLLAPRVRAISYTQRHFGEPRDHGAKPFGTAQQAEDLIALLNALGLDRAHVAAWSYAAHPALAAAVAHPHRIASLAVYDPGFPTYVTDPDVLEAMTVDSAKGFGPVMDAVTRQDWPAAAERLCQSSLPPGGYTAHPDHYRRIHADNAATIALLFSQTPPVNITPDDLRGLALPVAVGWGETSPLGYRTVAQAASMLIPDCHAEEIDGAGHLWPEQDAAGFAAFVARALPRRS